jgi:hypothetical protein
MGHFDGYKVDARNGCPVGHSRPAECALASPGPGTRRAAGTKSRWRWRTSAMALPVQWRIAKRAKQPTGVPVSLARSNGRSLRPANAGAGEPGARTAKATGGGTGGRAANADGGAPGWAWPPAGAFFASIDKRPIFGWMKDDHFGWPPRNEPWITVAVMPTAFCRPLAPEAEHILVVILTQCFGTVAIALQGSKNRGCPFHKGSNEAADEKLITSMANAARPT